MSPPPPDLADVSSRKSPKIWVLDQQTLAIRGEIPIQGERHEMGVVNR